MVKGHLVAAVVDAGKGVVDALLDLAVDNGVGGDDVGVASGAVAWGVDFFSDGLSTEPIAVVCDGKLVC